MPSISELLASRQHTGATQMPAYLDCWQAEADVGPQQHLPQDGIMPDGQFLQFDQRRQPFNLYSHILKTDILTG